jgi:protein involved in polysaccharide export with SLBB domain
VRIGARFAFVGCALLSSAIGTTGQTPRPAPPPKSDLERENLKLVAASAGEIKVVLLRDAGLMVELKRWAAKDAAEHGQILSDSDLTNQAVLDRLATDVSFRGVATTLLRRYGYLLPKLNPESDLGKERDLVIHERARWLAKHEEEQLTQTGQRGARETQSSTANLNADADRNQYPNACDPRTDEDCSKLPSQSMSGNESAPGEERHLRPREPNDSIPQRPSRESTTSFNPDENEAGVILSAVQGEDARADEQSGSTMSMQNARDQIATGGFASFGAGLDTIGTSELEVPPSEKSNANPSRKSRLNSRNPTTPQPQPVVMTRKLTPYDDIPSLYDMYVQAVARPTVPKRFGSEVFENGTRDSQLIPMDLPVGPEYVVGPGDGLSIDLWGSVSRRFYRVVDRGGRVSLPEVGPLLVSGKSLANVQEEMQRILRTQFRDVSADVSLARLRTIRVYEVGDITNPGAYDISSLSTPLNALFAAGGPTPRGSFRIVKHYRGNELVQMVDLYDLLLHGVKADIERLENGDSVLVPPIGPQVTVEGMVRRPAIYELKDEKSLASVLELAGGLLSKATLRHIEVQRTVANKKQTMLSLDIGESDENAAITQKLESFEVYDGDRIRIYPIAPANQDAVYLEGHVLRPGQYSYRANMHITDLISTYKELLPEPALQYAEIIRLNAPDFHPSVESFNLGEALDNPSQSPIIQPMDTIRVFSRFDFENAPTVSVGGDVRKPGTYRTSGQIHLSDAIHLAGGLAPDAATEDAQVFRYMQGGKVRIFSVSLSQAMEGNPTENILLQPRDRLLIHRSPDAVEPAAVSVLGAVGKPGRYPFTREMTAAELIRVGGGLRPSADTQLADLTRYQWQGDTQLAAQHETIDIRAALAGDPKSNVSLHNGDVLTIRQLPDWNDLGASIAVKGEVEHPGTYGIRPGERLSSILERAGGFQHAAYPYGAVLQRVQVREVEAEAQDQIILRVKDLQTSLELLPGVDPKEKQAKEMTIQQYQTTLQQLVSNPPVGRVAIRISSDINRWKNTSYDIEVRAGDTLVIPKTPSYVMVTGSVFNPTAVSYRPSKSAKWYLGQSGGPTQLANKKAIFVIRADGSVIGSGGGLWSGDSLNAVLHPGDSVVVPEKAIGGGVNWQNVFTAAQLMTSISSAIFIALRY